MKKIFFKSMILLLVLGCSKNDNTREETSLVGKWKAEATLIGTGGDVYTNPIEDGQTIIFREDSSFEIVDSQLDCFSGNYGVTENSEQNFNMDVISLACENGNLVRYAYSFEEGKLLLSFIASDGSTGCDEICAERYIRLSSE